jgi:predicted HicB family RNase H-like nuclease
MKNKCFEYKGFNGSVEASIEDGVLHGKILFVSDLVTYEADTIKDLDSEFKAAVDDYLETCKALDMPPCKPFKGSFNVRIGAQLHKDVAILAAKQDVSLNDFIKSALEKTVKSFDEVSEQNGLRVGAEIN